LNKNDLEDLELVRSFQNGDEEAFQKIFLKYRKNVLAAFIRQQIPQEDAFDLFQELFIHLYEKLPTLEIQSSFRSFLNAVIRNKIIDFYRKIKKFRLLFHISIDEFFVETDKKTNPENQMNYKKIAEESPFDFLNAVEHCLNLLGNPRWKALISLWLDGCRHEQISELLNMPIGSVSSGLYRCIPLFIECMKKHYYNL
jgi:RNA polymerase sigma-70 factor (ECF subfamily)